MDFGDNQQMRGRFGVDIFEDHDLVVFKDNLRANLPFGDFTEDAVLHTINIAVNRKKSIYRRRHDFIKMRCYVSPACLIFSSKSPPILPAEWFPGYRI